MCVCVCMYKRRILKCVNKIFLCGDLDSDFINLNVVIDLSIIIKGVLLKGI